MALSVDREQAKQLLEAAWNKVGDATIVAPPEITELLKEIILSKRNVAFKYVLVTGLLGKLTNPDVHPRALQAGSSLEGAYDARTLCHKLIVGFEKSTGLNLWGLSNEPIAGKAARHPEHDKHNRQLKSKRSAEVVHDILEYARTADPKVVEAILVHALRLSKEKAQTQTTATVEADTTYADVIDFVNELLEDPEGGASLVAVTGAFALLLNAPFQVKVYPPNVSDKYAGTAGDIEIFYGKKVISAFECKHRPLAHDDVIHGCNKAKEIGLTDYHFVYADGLAKGDTGRIKKTVETSEELDLHLEDIHVCLPFWASLLNPVRRATFGITVSELLRTNMKLPDAANRAAELWNEITA